MRQISVDVVVAERAVNRLEPACALAGQSASSIDFLAVGQSLFKWGVESAPEGFGSEYSKALLAAGGEVAELERRLSGFVSAVRSSVRAFEGAEGEVAARARVVEARVRLAGGGGDAPGAF